MLSSSLLLSSSDQSEFSCDVVPQKDLHHKADGIEIDQAAKEDTAEHERTSAKKAQTAAHSASTNMLAAMASQSNKTIADAPNRNVGEAANDAGCLAAAITVVEHLSGNTTLMEANRKAYGKPTTNILNAEDKLQDLRASRSRGQKRKYNNRLTDNNKNDDISITDSDDDRKMPATERHATVTPVREANGAAQQATVASAPSQTRHNPPADLSSDDENFPFCDDRDSVIGFARDSPTESTGTEVDATGGMQRNTLLVPSQQEIAVIKRKMAIHTIAGSARLVRIYDLTTTTNNDDDTETDVAVNRSAIRRFNLLCGETTTPSQAAVDYFIGSLVAYWRQGGSEIQESALCLAFDAWFFGTTNETQG